jgi:uncharacterized membrane protein YjjP (DUF1212 family)
VTPPIEPSAPLAVDGGDAPPSSGEPDAARVLRVVLRIAVGMLGAGAPTDDVESDMVALARGFGVGPVQAAVTFSMVSISLDRGDGVPITILHFVRDRTVDFNRLASLSQVVRRVRQGGIGVDEVEAWLDELEERRPAYLSLTRFVAPAVSAAGSTIIFGGNALDALATFGVALAIQPALSWLDRTSLPPFFRVAFGAGVSAALVALLVIVGAGIEGGLVLTGSLLRFLPGYALVSGFRDLVSQSIVSGTARLAEALLMAAAIAGALAVAIRLAGAFNVQLGLDASGSASWSPAVLAIAALMAVGGFAIQLGVPRREVAFAGALGAIVWMLHAGAIAGANGDTAIATVLAAVLIGAAGRLIAQWRHVPPVLFVVPAILPLLPGLLLVQAMLATTDIARVAGLIDAIAAALLVGVGVATGDILAWTAARVRERVLAPAVSAVAGGVEVLVVGPVARVFSGSGHADGEADEVQDPGETQAEEGVRSAP